MKCLRVVPIFTYYQGFTLPTNSYPYWLSSLIDAQDTADGYSKLVEDTNTFFCVLPNSVPIYSAASEMADGFTSFNGTQKHNAITVIKYTE